MAEQSYYPVLAKDEPQVLQLFQANVDRGDANARNMVPQGRPTTPADILQIRDYYRSLHAWFTNTWTYHAESWNASGFPELKKLLTAYLKDVSEVIEIHNQTLRNSAKVDGAIAAYNHDIDGKITDLMQDATREQQAAYERMNKKWSDAFKR